MTNSTEYSPEFRLILSLLSEPEIRPAAPFDIDWAEFFRLIRRHRIDGLAANLLLQNELLKTFVPAEAFAGFAEMQRQSLAREMASLVEAKSILNILAANDLEPILLKGLTLSHGAFGRIGWRNNYDTDILLHPDDIPAADRLLRKQGYARFEPGEDVSERAWAAWRRRRKDAAYRNDKTGSVIELHWRLFDNRAVMKGPFPTTKVTLLGNLDCVMLEPDFNVAYVCCHGSQHAFSRLKWLADVYFLARKSSGDDLTALYGAVDDSYTRAAMAQALLLCNKFFALPLPAALVEDGVFKKRNVRLAAWMAEKTLTRGGSREIESLPFGATLKTLSHYVMSPAPAYLAQEAVFDLREKFHKRATI
ncbi:nucleotidyltransferase domain-containing protein [Hyphococcus sp.]|jgi:hypothetical protein|uniref:nucleotidyltransferase domain-containing protein n=1 Tax=Hyphococcus sp. TaxID=2038636 RepID=UPI003D10AE4E